MAIISSLDVSNGLHICCKRLRDFTTKLFRQEYERFRELPLQVLQSGCVKRLRDFYSFRAACQKGLAMTGFLKTAVRPPPENERLRENFLTVEMRFCLPLPILCPITEWVMTFGARKVENG